MNGYTLETTNSTPENLLLVEDSQDKQLKEANKSKKKIELNSLIATNFVQI